MREAIAGGTACMCGNEHWTVTHIVCGRKPLARWSRRHNVLAHARGSRMGRASTRGAANGRECHLLRLTGKATKTGVRKPGDPGIRFTGNPPAPPQRALLVAAPRSGITFTSATGSMQTTSSWCRRRSAGGYRLPGRTLDSCTQCQVHARITHFYSRLGLLQERDGLCVREPLLQARSPFGKRTFLSFGGHYFGGQALSTARGTAGAGARRGPKYLRGVQNREIVAPECPASVHGVQLEVLTNSGRAY